MKKLYFAENEPSEYVYWKILYYDIRQIIKNIDNKAVHLK